MPRPLTVVLVGALAIVGVAAVIKHGQNESCKQRKKIRDSLSENHEPCSAGDWVQANRSQPNACASASGTTMLPAVGTLVSEAGLDHHNSPSIVQPSHLTGHTGATWSSYEPSTNKAVPSMPASQCGAPTKQGSWAACQPTADTTPLPSVARACPSKSSVSEGFFQDAASVAQAGGMSYASFGADSSNAQEVVSVDPRQTMQLSKLMPSSWREGAADLGAAAKDEWSKYIPTKEKFSNYITASGSARMSQSDRTGIPSRLIGNDWSGRPKPAMPLSTGSIGFGDSSHRMDLAQAASDRMSF